MPYPNLIQPLGPVYTAAFSAQTLSSNAYDLFTITAPSNSRVVIKEIRLGQYSDFGDAQAELLSLTMMTGSTSVGSTSAITPRNLKVFTGVAAAGAAVFGPSTSLASTASAVLNLADTFNVMAGWLYKPDFNDRIELGLNQRLVLRVSAPNDSLTINGTMVFQEIGQGLGA